MHREDAHLAFIAQVRGKWRRRARREDRSIGAERHRPSKPVLAHVCLSADGNAGFFPLVAVPRVHAHFAWTKMGRVLFHASGTCEDRAVGAQRQRSSKKVNFVLAFDVGTALPPRAAVPHVDAHVAPAIVVAYVARRDGRTIGAHRQRLAESGIIRSSEGLAALRPRAGGVVPRVDANLGRRVVTVPSRRPGDDQSVGAHRHPVAKLVHGALAVDVLAELLPVPSILPHADVAPREVPLRNF